MEAEVELFLERREELKENLKEWVKDKSISLDRRWDLFFKSGLGEHEGYYKDFTNFNSDLYCDNVSRNETINLEEVEAYYWFKLTPEETIEFKEDVLSKFIKSFEWDW